MKKALPLAASAVILAVCPVHAQDFAIAPFPDWTEPPMALERVEPSGDALTVLSYDVQTRFESDAAETLTASRVRVETPEGLQVGNVGLSWTPLTSELTLHEVAIERDGAVIDALGDGSQVRVVDAEPQLAFAMMHGGKIATMQVEGLRVGDTLRLAYTITTRDPLVGAPVAAILARPEAPEGAAARFHYLWDGQAKARVTGELGDGSSVDERRREATFTMMDAEHGEVPVGASPRAYLAPRFELSAFGRWEGVSELFEDAYDAAAEVEAGSELAAEARRIEAATRDPVQRADLALDLVQDQVRYVFSALETGGYAPASAEEVWAKRYGDCKGKTALLLALLRELGIEATPALVSTRLGTALPELLPTHLAFDHVVVVARIEGTSYWLDGTQNAGSVADSNLEVYAYALPMTRRRDDLVRIEAAPGGQLTRTVAIEVDGSAGLGGELPVTVRQHVTGPLAQAVRAAAPMGPDQRKQHLAFLLGDLDARFEWEGVEVDAPDTGPAVITATGTAELFSRGRAGTRSYVVPGGEFGWNPKPMIAEIDGGETRTLPWFVGQPSSLEVETTLRLPSDDVYYLDGLNTDAEAGGLTLRRQATIDGDVLTLTGRWANTQVEIAPDDLPAAADLLRKANWREPTVSANPSAGGTIARAERDLDVARGESAEALLERANAAFEVADYEGSVELYDAAEDRRPLTDMALADRAMALTWLGRTEEASEGFATALTIDPENWVALHGQGVLLVRKGEHEAAIERFDRAISRNPADDFARRWRTTALTEAGRYDEAIEAAEYLVRKHPDDPSFLGLKLGVMAEADRTDEALHALDEAETSLVPSQRHAMRAGLLEEAGRLDEALVELDEAVRLDSGNADLWNRRCWFKATNDMEVASALADCDRALALRPDSPAYLDSRGLVHLREGRYEQALADYDTAIGHAPGQAASLYGRALTRLRMGDEAGARSDLAKARQVAPAVDEEFEGYGLRSDL